MSYSPARDFALEVARGNIAGVSAVNKFGRDTDSDAADDVWDNGGTWVAPTAARVHQITSTDAGDDGSPVGVGARTIRVYGLTGWGAVETSEDITMNGVGNVPTAAYVIIHRMKVLTKGATNTNVGIITATADSDSTVTATILAGAGQSLMAIYGIPSTQSLYLTSYYCSAERTTAVSVDVLLKYNPEPDVELLNFLTKHTIAAKNDGSTDVQHQFNPYYKFAGPGIIKVMADASAVNADISAGFDGYLVTN